MHVSYRDLAIRNCLLGKHYLVKVADFGKSRMLQESQDFFVAEEGEKIATKWSAPELIGLPYHSSTKSDVWCKYTYLAVAIVPIVCNSY